MATRDEIDEIRNRIDLIEFVSRYVQVRQSGSNAVALCPFHDDKSPSMTVSGEKGFYHCFACGAGGDIFKFLMEIEKLQFPEALRRLADIAGVTLTQDGQRSRSHETVRAVGKRVVKYYQNCMREPVGQHAYDYLINRGLSAEIIDRFQLGFAPGAGDHLLKQFGSSQNELMQLGLLQENERGRWSFFRGRVIFPLCSLQGDVVGFAGRVLDNSEPKYLNTRGTKLFEKSKLLYGIHLARETLTSEGFALLVEGYTDVIMAHQHGFSNAVASMGTAFTSDQARLMKRFVQRVVIAYDMDSAGQAATLRGIRQLLGAGLEVEIVELPKGQDPDGLLRNQGSERFREMLSNTTPFTKFYTNQLHENHDISTLSGKENMTTDAIAFVRDLTSPALKSEILKELSGSLNIPIEDLELRMKGELKPAIIEPIDSEKLSWEVEEHLMALLLQGHVSIDEIRQNLTSADFHRFSEATDSLFNLSDQEQINLLEGESGRRLFSRWMDEISAQDQSDLRRLALSEVRDKDCERAARQLIGRLKLTSLGNQMGQLQQRLQNEEANPIRDQDELENLQRELLACQMERKRLLQELGWGTIIVKGGGRDS